MINDQCHPLKTGNQVLPICFTHCTSATGKASYSPISFRRLRRIFDAFARARRASARGGTQGGWFPLGEITESQLQKLLGFISIACHVFSAEKNTRRKGFCLDNWWTKPPNRRFDRDSGSASMGTSTATIGRKVPPAEQLDEQWQSKSWKKQNGQDFLPKCFQPQSSNAHASRTPTLLKGFLISPNHHLDLQITIRSLQINIRSLQIKVIFVLNFISCMPSFFPHLPRRSLVTAAPEGWEAVAFEGQCLPPGGGSPWGVRGWQFSSWQKFWEPPKNIPSQKLTASLHLKMDKLESEYARFLFGAFRPIVSGALAL